MQRMQLMVELLGLLQWGPKVSQGNFYVTGARGWGLGGPSFSFAKVAVLLFFGAGRELGGPPLLIAPNDFMGYGDSSIVGFVHFQPNLVSKAQSWSFHLSKTILIGPINYRAQSLPTIARVSICHYLRPSPRTTGLSDLGPSQWML